MTTTTITDAYKYHGRFLDIEPSHLIPDGLFIGTKEHPTGARQGIHLDEDKARELIAAVTKHFGKKILRPKPKSIGQVNRERFDEIPVGARFEIKNTTFKHETNTAIKVNGTEFQVLQEDGTPFNGLSSITGHHLYYRTYTVIPEPTVAEQIRALAVGDQFTIHFIDRPIKGIKIDSDSYFRYDGNMIVKIGNELGAVKVVKSS